MAWFLVALGACTPTWQSTPTSGSGAGSLFSHPWSWSDDDGKTITFAQWRGTPLVVAAIYTSCDETCPRTLAKLRQIFDEYEREHRRAEFVVVTIDPATDTIARLHEYKAQQHLPAPWHLLRGDHDQTQEVAELLGVHVMDMEQHLVHESRISVFDGEGVRTAMLDVF